MKQVNIILFLLVVSCMVTPIVYGQDQFNQVLTIQSPEPESDAYFGYSIACNNGIIVVGEVFSNVGGTVYLFDSSGNIKTSLQPEAPVGRARFGGSVDFDGTYVVVGEPALEVSGLSYCGIAYIFNVDGNLHATLTPPEPNNGGRFGFAVAIGGDKLAVSESGANYGEYSHAGMVHVYDFDGNLLTSIHSPEPFEGGGSGGNFGYSLAFNENIIVVGEVHTTIDDKIGAGRVFLFNSDGDLIASIESPKPQTEGEFGQSVAINNDIILVGEHFAEVEGYSQAGKVHVFDLEGNYLYSIQSPEPEGNAWFGHKVAASEDLIVVSESGADGISQNEGLVYLYELDGSLITSLSASQPSANAEFGSFVEVCGETIAVGDRGAVQGKYKAGQVHVYERVKTEPSGGIPSFPVMSIFAALALYYYFRKRM